MVTLPLSSLSVVLAACVCPGREQESLADCAVRLHSDVLWLADDAREGRRAGSDGERAAAQWIAERMERLGLEPAGTSGYLQAFEVPLPPRDGGGSDLVVLRESAAPGFEEPYSEHVAPVSGSAAGTAHGPLLFRGFGIVDEQQGWDDYGDARIEGAVVLLVEGEPRLPAGTSGEDVEPETVETPHGPTVLHGGGWGSAASTFHKVMNARRRGAVAVLLAPHPDRLDSTLPAFDPTRDPRAGLPLLAVSGALASFLVPDYAAKAGALCERDARRAGVSLRLDDIVKVVVTADVLREKGTAHNVLGRLRGGRPAGAQPRTLVVGAHFDHLGLGGPGSLAPADYGQVHNGADDNASGTAAVLEVARRLRADPPAGEVLFALWSGEELGLLGSAHWVEQSGAELEHVIANINLDMVGRAGNGKCSILGVGTSPTFEQWMEEAGRRSGLRLEPSFSGTALGGSDHQSFLKKGIPALHLFTGLHADYHRPSDDPERFEAEGAARVVELTLELARRALEAGELEFVAPAARGGEAPDQPRAGNWSVRFGSMPDYAYEGTGLKLAGTSPGGPAERAGLIAEDVILQVGDVEVTSIHDFMYALQVYKPGDVVLTRFLRDGEEQFVRVSLEAAGR